MELSEKTENVLRRRYPNLAFLASILGKENKELINEKSSFCLPSPSTLNQIEVVYVFGLSTPSIYHHLKEWLKASKKRDLIFLEEDAHVLSTFFSLKSAHDLLDNPQVHIRFNMKPEDLKGFLQQCAFDFPSREIEVVAIHSNHQEKEERFKQVRDHLKRCSVVAYASFYFDFYNYKVLKNRLKNALNLPKAFFGNQLEGTFKNIPAIVCGAGPSLAKDIKTLKSLENQALIIAGGSALTALTHQNLSPHLGVAVDPNLEEYVRFKDSFAFETPLLYINQLHHRVFETCNGPLGYLKTLSGSPFEKWMEKKLNIDSKPLNEGFDIEALSVTTVCIEIACSMGCNPIILTGIDLAFSEKKTYCPGVFEYKTPCESGLEHFIKHQDIFDQPTFTTLEWIMESSTISRFAKVNQKKTKVINATQGGIGFKNILNKELKDIPFKQTYDLRGKLHQAIELINFSIKKEDIKMHLNMLCTSLKKAENLSKSALSELKKMEKKNCDPETGRLIFYQMEIEELDAYSCLLSESEHCLQKLERESFRPCPWNASSQEKHQIKWQRHYLKWSQFQFLIDFYLKLISQSPFTK